MIVDEMNCLRLVNRQASKGGCGCLGQAPVVVGDLHARKDGGGKKVRENSEKTRACACPSSPSRAAASTGR